MYLSTPLGTYTDVLGSRATVVHRIQERPIRYTEDSRVGAPLERYARTLVVESLNRLTDGISKWLMS